MNPPSWISHGSHPASPVQHFCQAVVEHFPGVFPGSSTLASPWSELDLESAVFIAISIKHIMKWDDISWYQRIYWLYTMIYIQFILDVFPFCCVSTWSRIRLDIKISRVSFGGKIVRACWNTPCAAVHQIHHSLGIASQELWHAVCCNKRGRQCKFWSKNKVTTHQNIRKKSPGQKTRVARVSCWVMAAMSCSNLCTCRTFRFISSTSAVDPVSQHLSLYPVNKRGYVMVVCNS